MMEEEEDEGERLVLVSLGRIGRRCRGLNERSAKRLLLRTMLRRVLGGAACAPVSGVLRGLARARTAEEINAQHGIGVKKIDYSDLCTSNGYTWRHDTSCCSQQSGLLPW